MTPQEIAEQIEDSCFDAGEFGFMPYPARFDVAECAAIIQKAIEAERARCARIASHVFLNDPYALHPDIAFDDMNESARTAAHSMAQTISTLIAAGVERASEL